MEIVFWSPVHGQSASTSNTLIFTLLSGIRDKKKCILTQTHFNYNNLEAPLVQSNSKSASEFFMDVGIDALVKRFKAERISQKTIENCCISLPKTIISLLPGTTKINREDFEDEIGLIAPRLIREVDKYYDLVIVDASPSRNDLSQKLMDDAAVVVVNLSQNIGVIDTFFHSFKPSINNRVFYLFGSYDCDSKYNINNIRKRYKEINVSNSGVIPYNTKFKDAQIESSVVEFVRKNINCSKLSDNNYFMMKSISATEKIIKLAGKKQEVRKGILR